MNKNIFITYNRSRKPEFQIKTTGYINSDSTLLFRKEPISKKGTPHLLSILDNFKKLKPLESKGIRVANVVDSSSSYIDFEYIDGQSLEKKLLEAVLDNNNDSIEEVISSWAATLSKLSGDMRHNHKYDKRIFGPNFFDSFSESKCIKSGLLDSNFDNVIANHEGGLTLIDYEWCFDHCIPYDYVFTRGLVWFGIRHFDVMSLNSERLDLVLREGKVALPRLIWDKYISAPNVDRVLEIEWQYFQNWVTGQKLPTEIPDKNSDAGARPQFIVEELDSYKEQLANLESENNSLKKKYNDLISSKAYVFTKKLQKIKKLLISRR